MKISVIFTTYNSVEWLDKVLWGFSAQSQRPFEVIVADDGSGNRTREVVERFGAESGLEIQHVWQPDEGFRKCRILNKAIVASRGDYLVFTDGDCIPHPAFVATHARLAERGRFLSGGYLKLPMETSRRIGRDDILLGRAADPRWLRRHNLRFTRKFLRLYATGSSIAPLLDVLTPTRPSWNGHNASTWKDHVLATNGFDERMQYGGQDREFGERLENAGIRGKQIRHRAVCVHLDHDRGYATPESIARNKAIRRETRRRCLTQTPYGIKRKANN